MCCYGTAYVLRITISLVGLRSNNNNNNTVVMSSDNGVYTFLLRWLLLIQYVLQYQCLRIHDQILSDHLCQWRQRNIDNNACMCKLLTNFFANVYIVNRFLLCHKITVIKCTCSYWYVSIQHDALTMLSSLHTNFTITINKHACRSLNAQINFRSQLKASLVQNTGPSMSL